MFDSNDLSEADVAALGDLLCAIGMRRLDDIIRCYATSPVFGTEHERSAALGAELEALHSEVCPRARGASWQAMSDHLLLQWEHQQPWPLPRRRKQSGLIRWLRDREDVA